MLPRFLPAEAVPIVAFVVGMSGFAGFMSARTLLTTPDVNIRKSDPYRWMREDSGEYKKLYNVPHQK